MPRHAAFDCLRSSSQKPLLEVDRAARERELDPRDTGLLRRIVGTEIRRRGTLRAVVGAFTHHKPKPDLATFLRIGLAQILFMDRVPEHAAVSETVRACADYLGLSKGRIVNGVLRNVLREMRQGQSGDLTRDIDGRDIHFDFPLFRDPAEHPHLWAEDALSIPNALHKKWTTRYGLEEANAMARAAQEEPALSIRVTGAQSAPIETLLEEFRDLGIETIASASHPRILLAPADATGAMIASAAFQEGRITIQGEHAVRAAEAAGNVEGLDVLDLCAAPGGKAAVLAERKPARFVATDISAYRMARMASSFERLGVTPPHLAAMDGTAGLAPGAVFDVVFLDAPCSNTGVLAQRPAARWRYSPKTQAELTALQAHLIREAASRVKVGGALVYSTCSLETEENDRIVKTFLKDASKNAWEIEQERASRPGTFESGGPVDGGYAVRLRRKAAGAIPPVG
ncbi:Ribosomal RNA small subunit methyltransferase B [Planctomycetes bacterium Poly30]|uniref:Ribosomal RNA small subunit methyltransferase B n=1 Tax=Saltatorellus ferox TaxID=2528018 RepID=A0A518EKB3_9BACT|nr:Ribosomal RNA small subunit methyltransferase B [Planctomycetes bacterium Poly30]